MRLKHRDFTHAFFGGSDFCGKRIAPFLCIRNSDGKCSKVINAEKAVLLIIQKRFGLLLGDLILNGKVVVMSTPLMPL